MKISFHINFHTVWGQRLCIIGSVPELGAWEIPLSKEMEYIGDGNWRLVSEVPPSTKCVEYRYFVTINDMQIFEEWEQNHRVLLEEGTDSYSLFDYWQTRPANIAHYSSAFTNSIFAHTCDAKPEYKVPGRKKLTIKIWAPLVEKHQSLAITGNQKCLGSWDTAKALQMNCRNFPEWRVLESMGHP